MEKYGVVVTCSDCDVKMEVEGDKAKCPECEKEVEITQ